MVPVIISSGVFQRINFQQVFAFTSLLLNQGVLVLNIAQYKNLFPLPCIGQRVLGKCIKLAIL
jgi:hypothetical protein